MIFKSVFSNIFDFQILKNDLEIRKNVRKAWIHVYKK